MGKTASMILTLPVRRWKRWRTDEEFLQGVNPLPTLLREGPYRFFFYSNEGDPREAPHVHVTAGDRVAKFWLEPVELASSKRLRIGEIADLRSVVERHRTEFVEAWHAHFDT